MNQDITCPKCKHNFDITNSLKEQVKNEALAEARKEYSKHIQDIKIEKENFQNKANQELAKQIQLEKTKVQNENLSQFTELQNELNQKSEQLQEFNRAKAEIEKLKREKTEVKSQVEMEFQEKLNQEILVEKKKMKSQMQNENQHQFQELQNELNQKSEQLQEFNRAKAEIEKLKREKSEISSQIEAELQEKLTQQLLEEKEKIRVENENQNNMKLLEKDTLIQQQKLDLENMKVKLEQGSTQLQGEVQELAIENWLNSQFPFDEVTEVQKGKYGADVIQTIHERERQNCGIIAYESKRTANWSSEWIPKFKTDIQRSGASIGVLVTSVMPKDMERAGLKDGVWVCRFDEFKIISNLLRDSIIKIDVATGHNKNRKEKMELLYDYIFGTEFKNDLNNMMGVFESMQRELTREKTQMMNHWKKREKHLEMIIQATSSIGGSITGISGISLPILESDSILELE